MGEFLAGSKVGEGIVASCAEVWCAGEITTAFKTPGL